MECRNHYCKYNKDGESCEVVDDLVIGQNGICENYEKGFMYYFYHAVDKLKNNFFCMPDVTMDVRYSIYYLMRCLPIEFNTDDIRGILVLRDSERKNLLTRQDILDMIVERMNEDELLKCIQEFNTNGLPNTSKKKEEPENKLEYKSYGWLSPTGDYTEADFGDHEKSAYEIIKKNNWRHEYHDWFLKTETHYSIHNNYRDFISRVKGYVLIHDPSGLGGYIVTHSKPLTKKQREFLYGFFMDMGMTLKAEKYLDD